MLVLFLTGATLALAAGLAVKFAADRAGTQQCITWFEFALGALVCTALVIPAVTVVGVKQARNSTVSYPEYWNGFERAATVSTTNCTRDGSCHQTYQCDPYPYTVHYTERVQTGSRTVTHSSGTGKNRTTYTTREPVYTDVPRTRVEIRYHSCPYATREHTYKISTTLGDTHTIGNHWVPADPQSHRWRSNVAIPTRVPSGKPALWTAAKARLDAGRPGGVTKVMKYENYVLASQVTALHKYSSAIADYRAKGLMPAPATGIIDPYFANKVYTVGPTPAGTTAQAWTDAMMRFNGRLGTDRQGDGHLILVTDPRATGNPDAYTLAVQAYWQSKDLGKNALSKNGLVFVAGSTDGGKTVAWARSFTGMPGGNERLSATILGGALTGTPMTPEALLSIPAQATPNPTRVIAPAIAAASTPATATPAAAALPVPSGLPLPSVAPTTRTATATPSPSPTSTPAPAATGSGALHNVVFGTDGFKRACMKGCGNGDVGYTYLIDQIQPTGGQKTAIVATGFVLALLIWFGLVAVGIPSPADLRSGHWHASRREAPRSPSKNPLDREHRTQRLAAIERQLAHDRRRDAEFARLRATARQRRDTWRDQSRTRM